ncbi:MAG: hypothetical protein HUU01_22775 [Saprospiraceae bacterium]|nr:hypothetical protein [Saprospiraceae bacterium]
MNCNIKKALICKNVPSFTIDTARVATYTPKAGDVGVFSVLPDSSGYIMNENGIACPIFEGDCLLLAFGSRYATNQFEGYVPDAPISRCQLLGRGGVAGLLKSSNANFKVIPPELELIGYATDHNNQVINTIQEHELDKFNSDYTRARVILSVGSSMDSGKTTTAAWLCGGLKRSGYRVAYLKLTGTAFPKDAMLALSRGADYAADFSFFGYPSTYLLDRQTLLDLYQSLVNLACDAVDPDYIVIEIADGLLQRETNLLLKDQAFMSTVHSMILSCGDSLGVLSGLTLLEEMAFPPFAVSGLFTASTLLIDEVQRHVRTPILSLNDLLNGEATRLLDAMSLRAIAN